MNTGRYAELWRAPRVAKRYVARVPPLNARAAKFPVTRFGKSVAQRNVNASRTAKTKKSQEGNPTAQWAERHKARRRIWRAVMSRRGSSMVESAIYMPITILCVMFTIYMMLNMYSQTALQSHLHLTVQAQSGKIAGVTESSSDNGTKGAYDRYRSAAFAKKINAGSGKSNLQNTATASVSQRYYGGRMTQSGDYKTEMNARSYAIKEIGDIRSAMRV